MEEAVLVVDDDTEVRETLAEVFRALTNLQVYEAADATEAIELFRAHPEIRAVISDRHMGGPLLDGDWLHCCLANELRARPAYFVLLHGDSGRDLSYFTQLGVRMVDKPVDDILGFVNSVVEGMRALRSE